MTATDWIMVVSAAVAFMALGGSLTILAQELLFWRNK